MTPENLTTVAEYAVAIHQSWLINSAAVRHSVMQSNTFEHQLIVFQGVSRDSFGVGLG